MVNVSEVEPFSGTLAAPNALMITGGSTTVRLAVLLVPPVSPPASVAVTVPVVLLLIPSVAPVTFTARVQEVFAAIVPLLREMELLPATAVDVPAQVLVRPLG